MVQTTILVKMILFRKKKGLPPPFWARGLRDQIQKWALQSHKTLYSQGFLGGLRSWSRKGPNHGVGVDPETVTYSELDCRIRETLSGTGDSQRDSRESIRANHSQLKPLFL